jgi:hypothetical protein
MVTKENSIAQFVKQQIRKWDRGYAEKAKKRVIRRESRRNAFIRKSYNQYGQDSNRNRSGDRHRCCKKLIKSQNPHAFLPTTTSTRPAM